MFTLQQVLIYACVAAALAALTGPIPGTSIILTGLELFMTYRIARQYGISLKLDEIGFVSGAIYAVTELIKLGISTLLEFFPLVGWYVLKPLVSFLFILALGKVLHAYFRDQRDMRKL